jgi:Spherulation-specific family 4
MQLRKNPTPMQDLKVSVLYGFLVLMLVGSIFSVLSLNLVNNYASATSGAKMIVVPYFSPSGPWQIIYDSAKANPGAIKYVIINPCSGPCSNPGALSADWQRIVSNLNSLGITTLGYIYYSSESTSAIDYYMKNNPAGANTGGIFFDKEGSQSADNSIGFANYANYVHSLAGVVYINPGYNYKYVINYLTGSTTAGVPDANVANIYESGAARLFQMSIPAGVSSDHLSAIVKSERTCAGMASDISTAAGKGVGNMYVTVSSYSALPNYFSNEAYYIQNGVSNC